MSEFKNKSPGELERTLVEKREALRVFRFGSSGAKNRNVKEGRNVRKDIARILTEQSTTKK